MEINMNLNRIRSQSLDDEDNFSAHSSGFFNSLNSANNSDSECSGPVSVRDMVQRYNKQFQKSQNNQTNYKIKHRYTTAHRHHSQHQLASTKSSFCGLNNYGSQMNTKQFNDQLNEGKLMVPLENLEQHKTACCKNCTACTCCQSRSLNNCLTTKIIPTPATAPLILQTSNENNQNPCNHLNFHCIGCGCGCGRGSNSNHSCCHKINSKDILAVENCIIVDGTVETNKPNNVINAGEIEELHKKDSGYHLQRRRSQQLVEQKNNQLLSTDSIEEAKHLKQQQHQPTETCYQSKTTIAKTSSGVRIIIDIFFDQEQCTNINATDIVGSRVETDIPQSRILSEFQQQIMTKNKNNPSIIDINNCVVPAGAAVVAAATSSTTSLNRC